MANDPNLQAAREFAELANRTLETVIASNVRRIRSETGRTQDQVAARLRVRGLSWTQSTVSEIEAGERGLDLGEFIVLALVGLGVPPAELLSGMEGPVWIAGSLVLDLGQLRDILVTTPPPNPEPGIEVADRQEAERKAARRLGIPVAEVVAISVRLWGQSLTAERDGRIAPDANHAARGHVTRLLVEEIAANVKQPAKPARTRKGKR